MSFSQTVTQAPGIGRPVSSAVIVPAIDADPVAASADVIGPTKGAKVRRVAAQDKTTRRVIDVIKAPEL
jgi:hypothetical protein